MTRWMGVLAVFVAVAAGLMAARDVRATGVEGVSASGVSEWPPILSAGAPAVAGGDDASAPGPGPHESHAWFVVPMPKKESMIVHVAPRRFARAEDGRLHGAEDGSVRIAARVDKRFDAAAAWGDRLYVLEDRPDGFESSPREVSSIRAARTGIGDLWSTEPRGLMDVHPSLIGVGRLQSFAATRLGPAALVFDRDGMSSGRVLRGFLLVDRRWVEVEMPREACEAMRRPRPTTAVTREGEQRAALVGTVEGLELVISTSRQHRRWSLRLDKEFATGVKQSGEAGEGGVIGAAWSEVEVPTAGMVSGRPVFFGMSAGRWVRVVEPESGVLVVSDLAGERWRTVRVEGDVGSPVSVASLDGVGRLAIVWPAMTGERGGRGPEGAPQHMLEVSVFSGREFHDGPWVVASPLAASDVRVLTLALLGAMSLVVVFVLKAESSDSVVLLPPGVSLAEPGRRATACAIDGLVALVVAGRFYGRSIVEASSLEVMLNGPGLWILLSAMGVGALVGTVCEWWFGRTLGKLVTGCEVFDAKAGDSPSRPGGRASLGACLVRNVLKWGLPPVGMTLLLDASWRHAGDRLSRTVVGLREAPDREEGA